ncbi:cell division protein FtsZ [Caenispirillum bisanense]|nr:cell division protein FtsZ [Caenispirillum bisanense]
MPINFHAPEGIGAQLKPRITVVGVGGAGGNAVNNMILSGLEGVDFVVANTDAQALNHARTDRRIQLGMDVTQGLGAGARPDVGNAAAEESYDLIAKELEGANMVFITAGMGGGTGTGAAPVISRIARDMGILTVGVVTKPFQFEGVHRMRLAENGIDDLAQFVDTLIIIPNQNLFRVANERTTFADAFKMADDVLNSGVRSVTDLMVMPGLINLDFADVRTVMSGMGRAMMGTGEADGENRALQAAEAAIANPLLEDTCMRGAKGVLINITGGPDVTLFEVDEAANRIKDEVESPDAHIIFGSCFDEAMEGKMRVSVVATGINAEAMAGHHPQRTTVAMPGAPRPQPLTAPAAAAAPAAPAPQQPTAEVEPVAAQAAAHVAAEAPMQAPAVVEEEQPAAFQATGTHGGLARPTAPAAPRFTQPRDVFIPRAPVTPGSAGHAAAPQHHQPEASRAAAQPQAAAPQPAPRPMAVPPRPQPLQGSAQTRTSIEPEEHRTLAQGLLARMTGLARRATPAAPHQEPEVRTQHHQQPQAPQARPTTEQMRLAVDPDDRVQTSSQDDDELEIPAFLRRQAN